MTKSIFDITPNVGSTGNEPSLREIITKYYQPHFPDPKARELADAYIAALRPAVLEDATGITPDIASAIETIADAAEPARLIEEAHCRLGIADRKPIQRAMDKVRQFAGQFK